MCQLDNAFDWFKMSSMNLSQLLEAFDKFGVDRQEVMPLLTAIDTSSLEKVTDCKKRLEELKKMARKGFRKVSFPLHPDRSSNPDDHAAFNYYNKLIRMIDTLTVGSLDGLAASIDMDTGAPGDADYYEEAQRNSFMAMAKWYKGPFIPVGWSENRGNVAPHWRPGPTEEDFDYLKEVDEFAKMFPSKKDQ